MSSLKIKKYISIKGVFENIRQSVNTPSPPGGSGGCLTPSGPVKLEMDLIENLISSQFTAENTVRHGFPFKALSVAFDPIQRLLAIGTRDGSVRLFGRPGIDLELTHDSAVMQVLFIVNAGKLLTACTDDSVNLWDFSQKEPELLQSLKLNKERLTTMSLEFGDRWLYLGTERGNVLIMNLETFSLSGYLISWNKCIDPMQKNHPGPVCHISANPADSSKLLIGYSTGLICLWDLSNKKGEQRYTYNQTLHSVSWHLEGRQFVSSYGDGSLVTWNVKPAQGGNKPQSVQFPHRKSKENSVCDPIEKVLWRVNRSSGEGYFVFSGGLPLDVTGVTPSITIMQGKTTTLLEMETSVLDFLLVADSPYSSDYQEPEAIIVMLSNDLVAIDCKASGYPCFKNPYSMDFNESPVTFCRYLVDCPGDLIPALYMVGSKAKKESCAGQQQQQMRGFSMGEWPVSGGVDSGTEACSYTELVITGHADGSLRFWDASSTSMQALHRLKTAKYFEKAKKGDGGGAGAAAIEEDPFAICQISLCEETRELAVAGASGQVVYFRFRKKETPTETKSMEIPIVYEVSSAAQQQKSNNNDSSPPTQQHFEFPTPKPLLNVASQSASYTDPVDGFNFDKPQYEYFSPLRLRPGSQRKSPGFHAELVCFTPWVNGEAPTQISCLTVNSNYGLMAYGNGSGLVVVDVMQFVCLLNMGTADLYGSMDPFQRMPKSPQKLDANVDIVRVDLSGYNQVSSAAAEKPVAPVEKNKSPECRRLQKSGSSADDSGGGPISKSHSSSSTSLDQLVTNEGVTTLHFVDSFTAKNDFSLNASLYVGTTLGSLIAIVVNLPNKGDPRMTEPVVVSPSGSIYRFRGAVLTAAFLDTSAGALMARGEPAENVKVPAKISVGGNHPLLANLPAQSSHDEKSPPSNSGGGNGDQQVVVVCTEKCAGVYALPSQRQMYTQSISESASVQVCSAELVNFGGPKFTPCLLAYTSDGFVKAYSVPTLRPMLDMYFVARTPRIERTLTFSHFGHGLFFCNANEVQKFTVSADFMRQLPEMRGSVFQEGVPTPEPPKQGFLKGLFGGGPKPLDREELFGETAGKVSSQLATHIPGANAAAQLNSKAANSTTEIGKAKMQLVERGQKLSELDDMAEAMHAESKQFASNAHTLLMQAKSKKWYQL